MDTTVPRTRRELLAAFSGLLVALLLAALDGTIVATALPTIVGELGGLAHLSWVVTAYLLAQTVVSPLYGKLGDLYGRRKVLQVAIGIFLVGSALCGASQSMAQLVIFRGIQGLGGGGLAVTAQAIVADLVPARDRGRWQGLFGAVFGLASIAGPLLGGFFTTEFSWRWIFYINLPLGLLALFVLRATLPPQGETRPHRIDYAGSVLLALALGGIVLVADLGGATVPWMSTTMLALVVATVVSSAAFLVVERRAAEPVLPLRLFGDRTFAVGSVVGFVVGFALFGSVTFVPLFLQVVKGQSPTASGLQMLPMMAGLLTSSIVAGQVISHTGRYKVFPVLGTGIVTAGLVLLSRLDAGSSVPWMTANLLLVGLGLGMVLQVLVIAVQNAVPYEDLGVATSSTMLFRLVGGSLGTSIMGAVLASRLASELGGALPDAMTTGLTPGAVQELAGPLRESYRLAFTSSLDSVFMMASVVAALGFLLAWMLPEHVLRRTVAAAEGDIGGDVKEAIGTPSDDDGESQLLRGLAVYAQRDAQQRYAHEVVARAGVDLDPLPAFLLMRLSDDGHLEVGDLAGRHDIAVADLERAAAVLAARGLTRDGRLCPAGLEIAQRLVDARRARLAELLADWPEDQREGVAVILDRLSRELVPDPEPEP